MQQLEGYVADLVDGLLDAFLTDSHADAAARLANPVPVQVMAERVIGLRDVDVAQTQGWVFAGSRFAGGLLRLDEMAAVGADAAGLFPWVSDQLDVALSSPGAGDVLDATAAGVRDGVLSRGDAAFNLMILLGAGAETTTALIGNAIRALAERPELQGQLRADPARVPAFVEEVLRFESPFRFHPRSVPHDTQLGDVSIPEGAMVLLLWGSANRDPSVFDEPGRFLLDRPNARLHVGFGRGIHYCVGAPLARLETRVVIERLLARTKHLALDGASSPRWVESLWVRRHAQLPIVVEAA